MAYLATSIQNGNLKPIIASLPFVGFNGDWHDYRIRQSTAIALDRGMSLDNPAIRTVEDDKLHRGAAEIVVVTLDSGPVLSGKLQGNSMKITNRNVAKVFLEKDLQIDNLKAVILRYDSNAIFEIG